MVEFEELRLRLLDSEKPIENLKEALAIDSLKAAPPRLRILKRALKI